MTKSTATQLAEFKKDIQYLTQITEKGFSDVKQRQDLTNGKVIKNEKDIIVLKEHLDNHCNRFLTKEDFIRGQYSSNKGQISYLLTIIAGIIIAITANFIISKLL